MRNNCSWLLRICFILSKENGDNMRKAFVIIIIILLISAASILIIIPNINKDNSDQSIISVNKINSSEQLNKGYGVMLFDINNTLIKGYDLKVKKNGLNCYLNFISNVDSSHNYSLIMYMNYKQVPFKIGDKMYDKYDFSLEPLSETKFPLSISSSNANYDTNSVIFSIIIDPLKDRSKQINIRYNAINSNSKLKINSFANIIKADELNIKDYKGFQIINEGSINKKIIAKPDQDIDLEFKMSGDHIENCVWLLLNFMQTPIDNYKNLYLKFNKNNQGGKNISFKTPSKKGFYKLSAIMVSNPFSSITDTNLDNTTVYESNSLQLEVK